MEDETITKEAKRVSIRKVNVSFGAVRVIQDLNLEIEPGEFLVLLGPSGCGKSTLLNAVAGLTEVSKGQIWIDGSNVTWHEPKHRHIGMVFQSYALYPQMTVRGNLSFGLRMTGVGKKDMEERVDEAAEILKLTELLNRKPRQLSGGQRQRVAIGRALVSRAGVFLFDEPLSNLDAKLRIELRGEIKRLHRQLKATMIFVTHDQIEALTLADRIAIMDGGAIQQIGTPGDVYLNPASRFVAGFIGSPSMNFFEGRLQVQDGKARFEGDGFDMPLDGYAFSSPPEAGRDAVLGIRPEHISTRMIGDGRVARSTPVHNVEPMGAETLLWGRLGEEVISIRVDSLEYAEDTKDVAYEIDPGLVSIFDRSSSQRL